MRTRITPNMDTFCAVSTYYSKINCKTNYLAITDNTIHQSICKYILQQSPAISNSQGTEPKVRDSGKFEVANKAIITISHLNPCKYASIHIFRVQEQNVTACYSLFIYLFIYLFINFI